MSARRRLTALLTTTAMAVTTLLALAAPASAEDTTAAELLTRLRVASEAGAGYDRTLFEHWTDTDGNGCDTRREVLVLESTVAPVVGAGCTVSGQWTSWYDGAVWTDPAAVDVDHFVPLAEAWASGANAWTATQRRDFANDLGIPESLEAVTDTVNQSKSDSDPAEWLPPLAETHCRYAVAWVRVKLRWSLTVDPTEQSSLGSLLSGGCGSTVVAVPALAVTTPAPTPSRGDQLAAGATLAAGAALTSPNAKYRAVMQTDGNVVVYAGSRVLWNSRTGGNPGARLAMQNDGNLVVYSATNRPLWQTATGGKGGVRLSMQDDGNLVLYSATRPVWNTGPDRPAAPAPAPTPPPGPTGNTVRSGQTLASGQSLRSPNGRYRLVMQTDGNLVTYSPTRAMWSSRTGGRTGARLVVQGDGNAVVYEASRAVFSTRTNNSPGARMVVQDDGNLVVYSASNRPIWSTGPDRTTTAPPPAPTPPPPPSVSCNSAYPDFCIPAGRDYDCPEVRTLPGFRPGFTVKDGDPYRLDGSDNDGKGCE